MACGDVLSLEDLQTAKKHQTFEAEVITGKAGGVAGGASIDYATNQVTGQTQKTLPAVLRDVGFEQAGFDFNTGGVLGVNDRDKVVFDPVSKTWYSWAGALPHVVPAGTNPVGVSNWMPQTDPSIRSDLSAVAGAKLVGYKHGGTLFDLQNYVTPQMFGGVADGTTDNSTAITAASAFATANNIAVYFPAGTYISGKITVDTNSKFLGDGIDLTILKLKNGSNTDLIYGRNSDALWGSQSLSGVQNFSIEGMTLDGNKSNNTAGSGIAVYGQDTKVRNVSIRNFAKYNMRTEWADSGDPSGGMEGSFENLILDKSGEHGWRFAGPHDSVVTNVIIISSGQKTDSTYDGLFIERGNARWSGVHVWTSAGDMRSRYALNIARASEGNEFALSHFEGANTNVNIDGDNNVLDVTCKVYYPWNGNNVVINGSNVRVFAFIGEEYKGIGLPLANGVTFGGTYGGVSNSVIDIIANGLEAGAVYFGSSAGYNTIKVRGYSAAPTTVGYGGAPANTDIVDLVVSGGNLTVLKKDLISPRTLVGTISGTGTLQIDAAAIDAAYDVRQISGGAPGSGVKLPNTAVAGTGYKIKLVNTTGVAIKVYPYLGGNILGMGVDNPLLLSGLQAAEFIVSDGAAGTWLAIKGS